MTKNKKYTEIMKQLNYQPIGSVLLRLYGFVARLFCNHDYNLINQYTMDSEFDIVVKAGKIPNTHNSQTRKIITDYKCSKCNNIKRLTAKTPRL